MKTNKVTHLPENILEFPRLCQFLSERSPQPMLAVEGVTHCIRYVNPAFCKLVGKARDELIGCSFTDVMPEGNVNGSIEMLDRVFHSGEPEVLVEQAHERADSYWSYSVWPILDASETITGVMVQVTDSSETAMFRKRTTGMNEALMVSSVKQHELAEAMQSVNKELHAANMAKNQFLATVSHEIRTPLNVIMGFTELLSLSDQSVDDRRVYGERIKRNSQLLLRLINDILDLAKVEAGKLVIENIEFNFPELLSDVEMVMRLSAEEKGLNFCWNVESQLPETVKSDPTRLKQILTNVLSNAIKFTSAGMVKVDIGIRKNSQILYFVVSDTGLGISSDQASKLFQPFIQGDASTTRKFGGTGLGLDLAQRLAHALGGDVTFLRSQLGKGAVFEVTLALADARFQKYLPPTPEQIREDQVSLDGLNILLAEDLRDNQILTTKFLKMAGAKVDLAVDGKQAVDMALSGSDYDVILMDIQMPKLDGFEATKSIRNQGCDVPIVAITAHVMRDEIEHCREVGCTAHLAKPLDAIELRQVVRRLAFSKKSKRRNLKGSPQNDPNFFH